MGNKELLTCPFCGGSADINGLTGEWAIVCDNCNSAGATYEIEADAIHAWNSRKYSELKLTRSDIERMVKPLQWEEQTMHCFGTKDLKAIFHGLVFLITPHYVEQIRGLKTFHLTVHGTLVYVTQNNDKKKAQDELKQYAQKWLVDFVCLAQGVEE